MGNGMNKELRLLFKIVCIMLGLLVIAYILAVSIRMQMKGQPEGEQMPQVDARILLDAAQGKTGQYTGQDKGLFLTYGELNHLLAGTDGASTEEGQKQNSTKEAWLNQYMDSLREKYEDDFYIVKEDFYTFYDAYIKEMGLEQTITEKNVTVLGIGAAVKDGEGVQLAEDMLLTEEGTSRYLSPFFWDFPYQVIKTYQKEEVLLAVKSVVSRGYAQKNIWVMEAADQTLTLFTGGFEIAVPFGRMEADMREQVADLEYADGVLQQVNVKSEKVSGKLLSVKADAVELEGSGTFALSEDAKFYKLYGKLSQAEVKDVRIGYDFYDFVLEDGKICAGLMTRDEAMENIRVIIKNTDFAGAYHEAVEMTADTDLLISYGSVDDRKQETIKAGETVSFDRKDSRFEAGRIYVEPAALTGRIQLSSIKRAQGTPSYRGKMEITSTEEGLVVVNELLLEEYLYSVVPSEMPASYPLEALKAQAVCARTYAYRNMLRSGLASLGAHVDDSAGFQVYNNIAENVETTKAVKETSGELLYYGEELCGSYYYSTSCGFGTDTRIWKSDNKEDTSYLEASRIGEDKELYTGKNMAEEGTFENYIKQEFSADYEVEEPWYRWSYEVDEIDPDQMLSIIEKRYEANSKLILTRQEDGSYESKPIGKLGDIEEIEIEVRNEGGAADELIVRGTKNTYRIISEHNIRYVLRNGSAKVVRKDGSEIAVTSLLPSAYMVIETKKEGDKVTGYKLTGGGYGHGVGMSQNGARSMAQKGFDSNGILTYFYQSCEVKNIY